MKRSALLAIFVLLLLAACSTPGSPIVSSTPTTPQVVINAPASGMQFQTGADVAIQSTSTDIVGVLRVELLVDGQSVHSDAIPTGKSQPQFSVAQTWKATTPGTHIVIVRAINDKGVTGEASLVVTVIDAPKPTNTTAASSSSAPASAVATAKPAATAVPASSAQSVAPTAVPPTAKPAPTNPPAATVYTLILTEAQVNAIINGALAATQTNYVSTAGVSLQNGQISANTTFKVGNTTVSGRIVAGVSAASCNLVVTVVEATAGPVSLTEAQKVALNQAIERAIASQLAQSHSYTCVDSVTIANGVMVIKYH